MTNQRRCYPNAHKALWEHRAETNGDIPWPGWETEGGKRRKPEEVENGKDRVYRD